MSASPPSSGVAVAAQPFVCGGLAACFASVVIHPIDLVKVRMQLLGQGSKEAIPSPFAISSQIVKKEGFAGLYSGLSASLTRQATYGTARIGLHRLFSQKLQAFNDNKPLPFWMKTVSGMSSGGVAVCIGTPFDVALVRMQNDGALPAAARRNYASVFDALGRIAKEEGVGGLWRGLAPNILRGMSMNVGMMACYDQAKELVVAVTRDPNPENPTLTTKLLSSAAAGFCCAFLSLPFDMVKSRLQSMEPDAAGKMPYRGVVDCGSKILSAEGPLAFWRGFTAYYGRCAPHAMIILLSIEQITQWYRAALLDPQGDPLDRKTLVDSARVIGHMQTPTSRVDGDGLKTSFFALRKENEELEAEVAALRALLSNKERQLDSAKLADGHVFDIGLRVVAVSKSHLGHYDEGDQGVITALNSGETPGGASADPTVRWDATGKELQTSRVKIQGVRALAFADGVGCTVGLKVVALSDSAWGHYTKGQTGVISKLNPTDPVVKWDHSGEDCQASRSKLSVTTDNWK